MERQLTNLDTPIFDMTRTIDELDHPLAHFAERMKHWILRGYKSFLSFLILIDLILMMWHFKTLKLSYTSHREKPNL